MPTYRLLSWGANSHGQLGQGVKSEQCQIPHEVDLSGCSLQEESIKKIVGGAGHTLILDNAGHVYSCGWNNKGQAGQTGPDAILTFCPVLANLEDKHVVDIACGWDHSAALTNEGILYVWGSNNFGQLGRDPTTCRYSCEPIKVAINQRISRVSMGLRHTAIVINDGTVLVAGAGSKGQLGLTSSNRFSSRNSQAESELMKATVEVSRVIKGEGLSRRNGNRRSKGPRGLSNNKRKPDSIARLDTVGRTSFRQAYSLSNLASRFTSSPIVTQKLPSRTTESMESLKAGYTNSSDSVQIEEFEDNSDESEAE